MTFDDWWYDIAALTGWKCSHEAALEVWNASATAEREACADVVENANTPDCGGWTAQGIADAIRLRSNAM